MRILPLLIIIIVIGPAALALCTSTTYTAVGQAASGPAALENQDELMQIALKFCTSSLQTDLKKKTQQCLTYCAQQNCYASTSYSTNTCAETAGQCLRLDIDQVISLPLFGWILDFVPFIPGGVSVPSSICMARQTSTITCDCSGTAPLGGI